MFLSFKNFSSFFLVNLDNIRLLKEPLLVRARVCVCIVKIILKINIKINMNIFRVKLRLLKIETIIPFFSRLMFHMVRIFPSLRFRVRHVCIITCVVVPNPYFFNEQNKRIQPLYLAATIDVSDVYV